MLARDPLTGYFHYVPDQLLQGFAGAEDLSDGLGLPIAPLLAGLIPAIPSLLGGLFGGGNRSGEAPAAAPIATMAPPAPMPIPVPQMVPIAVPIPIPIPVPFRRWAGEYDAQPPIALPMVGAVPLRSHARRRRR
jgi:hypothetical protein